MSVLIQLAEKSLTPDLAIRFGIRQLLKTRLKEIQDQTDKDLIMDLNKAPIAVDTDKANDQHYELPSEFFQLVLGKALKYSSSYYNSPSDSLDEAEKNMLNLYCERAELKDGQKILELGCGWGSLSLHLAENYPNSEILTLSNSATQRKYIETQIEERGLKNLSVITQDINHFSTEESFDRIMSIEMFEHMRNYNDLFNNLSKWLNKNGKLFLHIFCHKDTGYLFETEGSSNWMGRYFFTGGIMPSFSLYENIQEELQLENKWKVNGQHYEKTCNDWLAKMDSQKAEIMPILEKAYGKEQAGVWFQRWRIFFASCAELFGFNKGEEWFVGHYLFGKSNH